MIRAALPAPHVIPASGGFPVLLSVPHSGTDYPDWLIRESRRGKASLEVLEDPLVDRLLWRALPLGCGAVIARAPRAAVDCNRSEREIDPTTTGMSPAVDPGPRARGGLGIVPTRTHYDGELWRRRISREEMERRIVQGWRPYHRALHFGLEELQRRHVEVLLLDCHSMPSRDGRQAQVVLGDRHGSTASRWLGDLARRTLEQAGYSTSFNDPYAGGWIVEGFGKPSRGVHALQIELDRSLYLDPTSRKAGAEFDRTARMLEDLVRTLGQALLDRATIPQAAE